MTSGQIDCVALVARPAQNDGCVCQHVVAGGRERSETETSAVMPEADQQHGTGEIDEQCAGASRREWQRRRGDGQG